MHKEIADFILFVKQQFWEFFTQRANVLDVGSGDYNGNNKQFFDLSCKYQGNDVFPGRNVDLVYKTADLPFYKPLFDTIISSECFQHDPEYIESLRKIISMLKPGGLFLFTCASTGREEHGTKKVLPFQSFGTKGKLSKWQNYYKNLIFEDIAGAITLQSIFNVYKCYYNTKSKDLLFWGIKKGTTFDFPIADFTGPHIEQIFPPLPPPEQIQEELPGIQTVNYYELSESEKEIVDMVFKQRSN
jgi:SAM-dependent methyltransferase